MDDAEKVRWIVDGVRRLTFESGIKLVADFTEAAREEARREERSKCCADICSLCAEEGQPSASEFDGQLEHHGIICNAEDIYIRAAAEKPSQQSGV